MTNEQTAIMLDSIISDIFGATANVEELLPEECFEDVYNIMGPPTRVCVFTYPLNNLAEKLEMRRDALLNNQN